MIVSKFHAAKVICFARITLDFCLIDFVFCSNEEKSVRRHINKTFDWHSGFFSIRQRKSPQATDSESAPDGPRVR